jgi:hypothetical protein
MKKKLVSVLLTAAMATTMLAGCGNSDSTDTTATEANSESEADTTATDDGTVEGEALPEAVYYFSFDAADDSDDIKVVNQDTTASSAAARLTTTDDEKTYIPGVKGDAIYTNGVNGYKLTNVNGVGETYTVSFWMYATRFSNYMPAVQFGPDVYGDADATGYEHWMNITRAEAGKDDAATFPYIWTQDVANGISYVGWAPDSDDQHMQEWVNVTIVVDENDVSTDGTMINAKLYMNGEEVTKTDSDGNIVPITVAKGIMEASDTYDFLVGVNYWDSVFKGAFDELYIFDQALTAGQALTLYQMGDPTVAFEEPERTVEVVASDDALYTLGSTDLSAAFWSDWTPTTEIKDGETKEISLKNYSDGVNTWDNFVIGFVNEENTEAHVDPNSTASDSHYEYAITRADLFSWGGDGFDESTSEYNYSWGNFATWASSVMADADVTVTINRSGSDLTINYDFVDYLGNSNTASAVLHTTLTADAPCYFFFTNEASYVEIYSIKDALSIVPDANAIDSIGDSNYALAFWGDWTESYELADGATKTVVLNNYSEGADNWDNYVIGFVNTYSDGSSNPNEADGYVEYAVLRADAYGWTDGAEFSYETSWGDDWATWLNAMKNAQVTLVISRSGSNIVVDATAVSGDETYTWTSNITNSALGSDPCYFFFTGEACYLEVLSVE